jgi:hypothetical protein
MQNITIFQLCPQPAPDLCRGRELLTSSHKDLHSKSQLEVISEGLSWALSSCQTVIPLPRVTKNNEGQFQLQKNPPSFVCILNPAPRHYGWVEGTGCEGWYSASPMAHTNATASPASAMKTTVLPPLCPDDDPGQKPVSQSQSSLVTSNNRILSPLVTPWGRF